MVFPILGGFGDKGRHSVDIRERLIAISLIFVGVATIMGPFFSYVVHGWRSKRNDIMNGFDKDARLAYFAMFSRNEDPPDDADTAADKFEQLYSQWYGRRFFIAPGILLFVVSLIEITFIVLTVMNTIVFTKNPTTNPIVNLPPIAIAAIAGAYMWVVNDLISRARRLDFSPADVRWGILRLVIAVPMGYAFTAVANPQIGNFIAFALGAFPLATVTSMMGKLANKNLGLEATVEEKIDDIIKLRGINREVVERLSIEDITTIPQIAYCDPVELVMRSNLTFNSVTDCMNQALAWMYLEDKIDVIRPLGLRGAVEIKHWLDCYEDESADPIRKHYHDLAHAAIPKIASAMNQDIDTLLVAFHEIAEDPFTIFIWGFWYSAPADSALSSGQTSPAGGPTRVSPTSDNSQISASIDF
jgi:hypothetical protein